MTFVIADRYELGASIGSGGMSEVFAATDLLIGREVAVKMLRPDLAKDINFRERFRREAQNAGKLSHPSIVAVFDTGEVDRDGISVPFIVMERVHGRDLRDIVREDGTYSPSQAATIMIPVCHALQSSHEAGIIHRDVKPANIMINNTGGVKVMDFGIARALDDSTSAMTQTAAVIGTAQYLSPEQARGKPADARSDVYAAGCVLYELVTGRPPFEGESPFAVAYQHVQEDPTPPSEHIPDLSPTAALNVDAVVLTAMAKHPADRYQTAAEMAADLELLSRNAVSRAARSHVEKPDEPETVVVPQRLSTPPPPPTTAMPAATAVAPAAPAAVGSRPAAAPQPKRGSRALTVLAIVLTLGVIGVGGAFTYDFLTNSSTATTQQIPNIVGLPENEAVLELEQLGFTVVLTTEPSPDVAEGLVIRTSPNVGSEIREGATVTLTISSGREVVTIPDVTGLTLAEATQEIEGAGLVLDQSIREENSDDYPAGTIIQQNPRPGGETSVGASITLTVSTGPSLVRVPVITGMQWSQAESNITSLGLVPDIYYVDSLLPEGQVIFLQNLGTFNTVQQQDNVGLYAVAAILVGGANVQKANNKQAIIGVLLLQVIFTGLTYLSVDQNLLFIVKGVIILVACAIDMRKYLVRK